MAPARPRVWFYGGYRKGEPAEVYSATTGVAVSPARQATRRQAMSGYTRLHGAGLAIAATTLDPGTRKEMACDVLRHLFAADHSEKVTAG